MNRTTRAVIGSLVASFAATFYPAIPTAKEDDDSSRTAVRQVEDELLGIEEKPSLTRIQKIPGAEEALRTIADDDKLPVTTRAKAVVALGAFPTPATEAFLIALVQTESAPESLRTRAPRVLAESFPTKALPILQPLLNDPNRFVRQATAKALSTLGTREAYETLQRRRSLETDPMVKKTLERLTRGK